MLEDTGAYYSRKGSLWILEEDSCPDYMIKAEECLRREKERVAHYLHSSSEQKLLEKVENEILSRYIFNFWKMSIRVSCFAYKRQERRSFENVQAVL
jgi:hypothetical protein